MSSFLDASSENRVVRDRVVRHPDAQLSAHSLPLSPAESTTATPRVRVILADSHAIFRMGLAKILAREEGMDVVAQAENYAATLRAVEEHPADVLLLEDVLSGDTSAAISAILRRAPTLRVIVMGDQAGASPTLDMLRRGAQGVVERAVDPALLIKCVRKVADGEPWLSHAITHWLLAAYRNLSANGSNPRVRLTPKEVFVANCVAQGMRNKDIAQDGQTSEQVIKNYLRKIFDKLGVADRLELAMFVLDHPLQDGIPLHLEESGRKISAKPAGAAKSSGAVKTMAAGASGGKR